MIKFKLKHEGDYTLEIALHKKDIDYIVSNKRYTDIHILPKGEQLTYAQIWTVEHTIDEVLEMIKEPVVMERVDVFDLEKRGGDGA